MGKKLIGIAVITIMLFGAFGLTGCNGVESENGLNFVLNRYTQEYTVYAGDGLSGEVVIPSEFKGKPVTTIMHRGFSNKATNGSYGVGKTDKIKSIFIPASIKEITSMSFGGCAELESITVAEDNPYYKSDGNCLIVIAINEVIAGCAASVIPDYIVAIASDSFYGTKLWNNAANDDIVYVGKWAVGYKGDLGKTKTLKSGTIGIGDSVFSQCSQLESITLAPTVIYIGEYAFYGCKSLKNIVIPLSVTYLSRSAFNGCQLLTIIYVEAAEKPVGWDTYWCPYGVSVEWGYGS